MQCPWGQGVYGWNRETYRNVVTAIESKEHIHTLDMAALSFGSVRYSYIDDKIRTAALVRPAAAPGTANQVVVAARALQLWKSIVNECDGCVTIADAKAQLDRVLKRYAAGGLTTPGRSVPLTDFDVASALVASAINPGAGPALGWKSKAATVDAVNAGVLSDALWERVGEEDVSPALVAYADEYCQAYPGTAVEIADDPVATVLAEPATCAGRKAETHKPKPVACLIAGTNDMSAPAALARTWQVKASGTRVTTRSSQHWFTDMQDCGRMK